MSRAFWPFLKMERRGIKGGRTVRKRQRKTELHRGEDQDVEHVRCGLVIVNASRIPPRPLGSSELSENWKARDLHVVRTRDYWLTVFLWRSLGASWGLLGASWGPLGALSGASWGPLGASWVPAPPTWPPTVRLNAPCVLLSFT